MKNKILTSAIILLALTSCAEKNSIEVDSKDYRGVAKVVYSASLEGNLDLYKTVSTKAAYKQFKEEITLMPVDETQNIDKEDITIRTDTVIDNVAWVSLKYGARDINSTLKLVKTPDGWKNDLYNIYKEKSPLKNEVIQFPSN